MPSIQESAGRFLFQEAQKFHEQSARNRLLLRPRRHRRRFCLSRLQPLLRLSHLWPYFPLSIRQPLLPLSDLIKLPSGVSSPYRPPVTLGSRATWRSIDRGFSAPTRETPGSILGTNFGRGNRK